MYTEFTLTATGVDGKPKFKVNLGCDILDGMTQEQKDNHARRNAVVDVQNDSKLGLRELGTCEDIELALMKKYPNVKCEPLVEKPKKTRELTIPELIDALAKNMPGLSREQLKAYIEAHTPKADESIEVETN